MSDVADISIVIKDRGRTSLSQLSSRCFLFCESTSCASSALSYTLSLPRVSRVPKYTSSGDVCPGVGATDLKRSMVSFVRSTPCATAKT